MTANGILSLLMSLALLLSGGSMAEDPAAPAGRTTTIDEIVLTPRRHGISAGRLL